MSVTVSAAIWAHSDRKGNELLVLLALADQANDQGVAWPSVRTLSEKARTSLRATRYLLRDLETAGCVVDCGEHPDPRYRGVTVYRIVIPKAAAVPACSSSGNEQPATPIFSSAPVAPPKAEEPADDSNQTGGAPAVNPGKICRLSERHGLPPRQPGAATPAKSDLLTGNGLPPIREKPRINPEGETRASARPTPPAGPGDGEASRREPGQDRKDFRTWLIREQLRITSDDDVEGWIGIAKKSGAADWEESRRCIRWCLAVARREGGVEVLYSRQVLPWVDRCKREYLPTIRAAHPALTPPTTN